MITYTLVFILGAMCGATALGLLLFFWGGRDDSR